MGTNVSSLSQTQSYLQYTTSEAHRASHHLPTDFRSRSAIRIIQDMSSRGGKLAPEVNRALFVKNLSYNVTPEDLFDLFGKFGPIRYAFATFCQLGHAPSASLTKPQPSPTGNRKQHQGHRVCRLRGCTRCQIRLRQTERL